MGDQAISIIHNGHSRKIDNFILLLQRTNRNNRTGQIEMEGEKGPAKKEMRAPGEEGKHICLPKCVNKVFCGHPFWRNKERKKVSSRGRNKPLSSTTTTKGDNDRARNGDADKEEILKEAAERRWRKRPTQ